jgi:hypothetical protein
MATYQGGQRSGRGKRKAPARPTASKPSDKRTNLPGGKSKPKPKPSISRPNLYETAYDTRAPRSAYGLTAAPTAPKPKPPTRTTPSRPAARPAAKPSLRQSQRHRQRLSHLLHRLLQRNVVYLPLHLTVSQVTTALVRPTNPLMKDMVARMKAREDKALTAAASKLAYRPNKDSGYTPKGKVKVSKDYSSQFKDMEGGSSRFVAELKKKKKAK